MSVTLTGCVDFVTGKIIFEDDICQWQACMIFSGIHAGQVALTPNISVCPDTYYGCVDFQTRTFSIVVPESCCAVHCDTCSLGTTPATITIKFSGIEQTDCLFQTCPNPNHRGSTHVSTDLAAILNDTEFELLQSEFAECVWNTTIPLDGTLTTWIHGFTSEANCSSGSELEVNELDLVDLLIVLNRQSNPAAFIRLRTTGGDNCALSNNILLLFYTGTADASDDNCFANLDNVTVDEGSIILSGGTFDIISQTGV